MHYIAVPVMALSYSISIKRNQTFWGAESNNINNKQRIDEQWEDGSLQISCSLYIAYRMSDSSRNINRDTITSVK